MNEGWVPVKAIHQVVEHNMDMQDLYLPVHFLDLIDDMPTRSMPGWISIKDRLPADGEKVLVCLYDRRRKKISNYPDGKRVTFRIDRIVRDCGEPYFWAKGNTSSVIAWMSLPEPPKEGT